VSGGGDGGEGVGRGTKIIKGAGGRGKKEKCGTGRGGAREKIMEGVEGRVGWIRDL